ncbi:MAG: response regulator [Alphaproteobacteria bacterium]|nr:response regulator [Alphaproteobacteria bacterium]
MIQRSPSARTLERFFRMAQDMLCLANTEGYFTWINPRWEQVLGWSTEQLTSRPFLDFVHPDDVAATLVEVDKLARGEPTIHFTNRYRKRDGGYCWIAWTCTPDPDSSELFAVARDVSRERELDRLKDEFISTVSHELRTPLTSIHGALGMLASGRVGTLDDQATRLVDVALRNCRRLGRRIDDILDLGRLDAGRLELKLAQVDVAGLLAGVDEAMRSYAGAYGVTLRCEPPPEGVTVLGDAERLHQVLDNLVSNALKVSVDGAAVVVRATAGDDVVRFEVVDQGPGIPVDFRARLFERFTQADQSSTRYATGTGLGLAIVRSLVEQHGGEVGFDTEIGQGTTMWFELARSDVARTGTGRDVLVVEDDPDVARLLAAVLAQEGFGAEVASTLAAAREALAARAFAAVTLDVLLPDGSGSDLLHELRADAATADLPVVVVSAVTDASRAELGGDALGVVDWLSKPIDRDRLVRAIDGVAGGARKVRVLILARDDAAGNHVASLLDPRARGVTTTSADAAFAVLASEDPELVVVDLDTPREVVSAFLHLARDLKRPLPLVVVAQPDGQLLSDVLSGRAPGALAGRLKRSLGSAG